jgi:hypothetical protein
MKNLWGRLVKAKLLKQRNILKGRSTRDMDPVERRIHANIVKMVEKELGLVDDEEEEPKPERKRGGRRGRDRGLRLDLCIFNHHVNLF